MKPKLTEPTDFQEVATEIFDELHQKYKKQKHEKIEKMAWELSKKALLSCGTITVAGEKLKSPNQVMGWCWGCAQGFCKLAKQQEVGNESTK